MTMLLASSQNTGPTLFDFETCGKSENTTSPMSMSSGGGFPCQDLSYAETAADIRRATREKNFRRVSPSWHCRGEITDLLAPVPLLSHGIAEDDSDTDESDCLPGLVSGRGGFMTLALILCIGFMIALPLLSTLIGGR